MSSVSEEGCDLRARSRALTPSAQGAGESSGVAAGQGLEQGRQPRAVTRVWECEGRWCQRQGPRGPAVAWTPRWLSWGDPEGAERRTSPVSLAE